MGFFTNLLNSRPLGAQPHKGWKWRLFVNGMPTTEFDWEDVAQALDGLGPHDDSFVILEQRQGKNYWFIQSAIALMGPHTGEYSVGVGWNDARGKHLVERCGNAGRAVDMFRAAWYGKPLDFTGFEDQSYLIPGNS